jgi:hypothetical protein
MTARKLLVLLLAPLAVIALIGYLALGGVMRPSWSRSSFAGG